MTKQRVGWVDVARFLGIYAIYLGHFGQKAGPFYPFVFSYHVALFFFISGCMENYNKINKFADYTKKKIKTILVPWLFFSVLSLFCNFFIHRSNNITESLLLISKGCVRNSFFASSLWFLTCIFVTQITFFLIKKLNYKVLILIASFFLNFLASNVLCPSPMRVPSWYYNIDSMMYYIIFLH